MLMATIKKHVLQLACASSYRQTQWGVISRVSLLRFASKSRFLNEIAYSEKSDSC